MWLAIGYTNKDNYYAIGETAIDSVSALITARWNSDCSIKQSIHFNEPVYNENNLPTKMLNDNFPEGWSVTEIPVGTGKVI